MTELTLAVKIKDGQAVFAITDNGCGIEKERLKTIFTGYFETGNLPADNQKRNMGIGLSVCASVIKAHEGEIMVENLKEGGCCFRFTLKMEEEMDE